MKVKHRFLKWLAMLLLLIASTSGTMAQYGSSGDQTVCLDSYHPYGIAFHAGSTYAWSIVAGSGGAGTITNGATENLISVLWTSSGTCTLQVIETNAAGCSAPAKTIGITVSPLPTPTFTTAPTPVCANSTGNVYTTQAGQSNYVWNVTGGTITAGGTATSNTVTVSWGAAGTGHVTVNYNNAAGCSAASATDQSVTINALPTPTDITWD